MLTKDSMLSRLVGSSGRSGPTHFRWAHFCREIAMLSVNVGEAYSFAFGSHHAQVELTSGALIVKTDDPPGLMDIQRPNAEPEFKVMRQCYDAPWQSIAIAHELEPGSRVVLDMGDKRLAIDLVGIAGKQACLWLGTEEPESVECGS